MSLQQRSPLVIHLPAPKRRVTIHCEVCGTLNSLAEAKAPGSTVHLVCRGCETPVIADVLPR